MNFQFCGLVSFISYFFNRLSFEYPHKYCYTYFCYWFISIIYME